MSRSASANLLPCLVSQVFMRTPSEFRPSSESGAPPADVYPPTVTTSPTLSTDLIFPEPSEASLSPWNRSQLETQLSQLGPLPLGGATLSRL